MPKKEIMNSIHLEKLYQKHKTKLKEKGIENVEGLHDLIISYTKEIIQKAYESGKILTENNIIGSSLEPTEFGEKPLTKENKNSLYYKEYKKEN